MQIACPACAATYQVPDALIGDGRQMRCARCGEQWFAAPPAPVIAPPAAEEPPPPPPPAPAPPPATPSRKAPDAPKRRGSPMLILAWAASAAIWAAGLYGFWALRVPLADAWPPLTRLYALLGAA